MYQGIAGFDTVGQNTIKYWYTIRSVYGCFEDGQYEKLEVGLFGLSFCLLDVRCESKG